MFKTFIVHPMRQIFLAVATCGLLIAPSFASTPVSRFEQIKNQRLEKIDAIRACIAQSNNIEDLKSCFPQQKSSSNF